MPYKDKNKQKEVSKKWYRDNLEKSKQYQKIWAINNKERKNSKEKFRIRNLKLWAIYEKNNICNRCGLSFHPVCYDFHHVDPTKKEILISRIANKEKLKMELDKCVLLCSNCHRLTHYEYEVKNEIDE